MAIAAPHSSVSIQDYLESELTARVKHEYVAGHIYGMTGASKAHNRIAVNVTAALNAHLRGGPCQVFMADIKVHVEKANAVYYPDVVVACERGDDDPYIVAEPVLVVEVLSPSTERTDREEKLRNYRQLDNLREYVLIAPELRAVEVHRRTADGWTVETCAGEGAVRLDSVALQLALTEVFADV